MSTKNVSCVGSMFENNLDISGWMFRCIDADNTASQCRKFELFIFRFIVESAVIFPVPVDWIGRAEWFCFTKIIGTGRLFIYFRTFPYQPKKSEMFLSTSVAHSLSLGQLFFVFMACVDLKENNIHSPDTIMFWKNRHQSINFNQYTCSLSV